MGEVARVYPLNRQQPEPLWREVLGGRLRALRAERRETLAETAERAGVSPQYLSEVERGRKEPSSEMIAALAGALDTTLADLTTQVTEDLRHSRGDRSDRGARLPRASSAPSAPSAPVTPSAPVAPRGPDAPSAPVALALAA
jgi:transcriptional regulator with XRE-family HTH domain